MRCYRRGGENEQGRFVRNLARPRGRLLGERQLPREVRGRQAGEQASRQASGVGGGGAGMEGVRRGSERGKLRGGTKGQENYANEGKGC